MDAVRPLPAVAPVPEPRRTWRRISLVIGSIPPAPGKLLAVDCTEAGVWRILVCAPEWLLKLLGAALAGTHPLVQKVFLWALKLFSQGA